MKKTLLIPTIIISLNITDSSTIAQGTWTQKANFGGAARHKAVSFSIGTKGYVGTGSTFGAGFVVYNDFWEWNQSTNVWTQKADFGGVARMSATGFSIGTKGYIGTGSISNGVSINDFWEYDQGTNTWSKKTDFSGATSILECVGFSIGIKGYIGLGYSTAYEKTLWEWDQGANSWTQKANFPDAARSLVVGFVMGNKGYIGTGGTNNAFMTYYKDFWEWDQLSNTWTKKSDFGGSARTNASGFSIGTKGYIGIGYGGSIKQDFWEWEQSTDTWTQVSNFGGSARSGAVGFSIGNRGYIGLGYDGSNKNDFWEYTPSGNSINEYQNKISISIFPNPFSTQTTLQTDYHLRNATLTVDNYLGQTVAQIKNLSGQTVTFSRDNLASGLYFVRLTEENKTIAVDKLVVIDK